MDAVLRAAAIYFVLILVFRITGKRSLSQITTFDFVLLLVISEATQQAMIGNDYSLTNAFLVILTLTGIDIGLSLLKQKWRKVDLILDSAPLLLIENGEILRDRMDKTRVGEDDILSKARELQGIERLDQIKYAVLERSGGITVIPKEQK